MSSPRRPVKGKSFTVPKLTLAQRKMLERVGKAMLRATQNHSQKELDKVEKQIKALRVPEPYRHLAYSQLFSSRMTVQMHVHPTLLRKTFYANTPRSSSRKRRR